MPLVNLNTKNPIPIVEAGDGITLIVNRDLTNQVAYGLGNIVGANIQAYSLIDPLGSVTVDGTQPVYAMALSGTPIIDVVSGAANWTPSPAQIAAQINTLGLATQATLANVNAGVANTVSTLGTPAQNSAVNAVNATLGTPAQNSTVATVATNTTGAAKDSSSLTIASHTSGVQIAGGIQAFSDRIKGAGSYVMLNGPAYIFGAWMCYNLSANGSLAAVVISEAVIYIVSSNQSILGVNAEATTPNQVIAHSPTISLPGLVLASGDAINLYMQGTPTNTVQTVSAGIIYTTTAPP